ncbi:MAG TPA: zinc-dependent metalloprotease family protein [Candidatus Thermoplasmatota archaeon]|nr:zinc-dependent metalloprotease family protein [Candidatus Thermoplasmatota archaeon]
MPTAMPFRPFLAVLLTGALVLAGCLAPAADETAPTLNEADTTPTLGKLMPYAPARALAEAAALVATSGGVVTVTGYPVVERLPTASDALGRPRTFELELKPSPMLTNATWAEVDGVRVTMPAVAVYEGHVKGAADQLARLTVTDAWARGSVRVGDVTYLIRVGLDGNLPYVLPEEQAAKAPANGSWTWTSTAPAPGLFDPPGWQEHECLLLVPPHVTPMLDLGRPTSNALTARIVLDGDAEYMNQTGAHAFPLLVAMLNEVDAIYEHEVGIRFEIVGLHLNSDPAFYPDPLEEAPQAKMMEYWNARKDVDRDIVHLVTGQRSNYAMANCIGGAGQPEIAYTFTPLNWERDYLVFHTQAYAHELGHIFSAHHHYGNHAESTLATIMIQGYTPGLRPVFGTLEKSVIRGWAEEYLGHDH